MMRAICFQTCSRLGWLAAGILAAGCADEPATFVCPLVPSDTHVRQLENVGGVTFARLGNGDVYCWGKDISGDCYGGYIPYPTLTRYGCVRELERNGGTCALSYRDAITVWGGSLASIEFGANDPYTVSLTASATPIIGAHEAIAPGGYLAVLDQNGVPWVWGHFFDRDYDVLTEVPFPTPLVKIRGGFPFCGLGEDGVAYCTGIDWPGTVGLTLGEEPIDGIRPVDLQEPLKDLALSTSVGCALTASGAVQCSGNNSDGLLGSPPKSLTQRRSFAPVAGLPPLEAIKLNDPGWTACGLADRRLYCWGRNIDGAIAPEMDNGTIWQPRLIEPFDDIVDFSPGDALCVLRSDGSVWCRGNSEEDGMCDSPPRGEWAQVKFEACNAFD